MILNSEKFNKILINIDFEGSRGMGVAAHSRVLGGSSSE